MENRWLLLSFFTALTIFQCSAAPDAEGWFFSSDVQTAQSSLVEFDTTTKADSSDLLESDLFDELLFTEYKKDIRPATYDYPVVQVTQWLSIIGINLQKTNWLEVFGWETIQWTDPRLIWNPTEFNNLKVINLDPDQIWIPDIILWNGSTQNSGRIHNNMKARVTSHGHVHYAPMVRHVIRCVPKGEVFDCTMTYGSWAYDSTQLALNITRNYVDTSTYNSNSDFTIVNTSAELHTSTSECCPGAFYDITYTITLKWKDSDSFDGLSPQEETGGYVSSTKYGTDKTSTGMNSTDTNNGTQSFDSPPGTNSTTSNNNTES